MLFKGGTAAGVKSDHDWRVTGFSPQSAYTPIIQAMKSDNSNYGLSLQAVTGDGQRSWGPFTGWRALTGLGPQEGPFPQWNLPVVRWGTGAETRLQVLSLSDFAPHPSGCAYRLPSSRKQPMNGNADSAAWNIPRIVAGVFALGPRLEHLCA